MTSLSLFTFMIGEGNGNPLQCSCLENPRDGGAWWAVIYGVTHSQTRLKRLSSSSSSRDDLKYGGGEYAWVICKYCTILYKGLEYPPVLVSKGFWNQPWLNRGMTVVIINLRHFQKKGNMVVNFVHTHTRFTDIFLILPQTSFYKP